MNLKTKLTLMIILLLNISLFAQDSYLLSGTILDETNIPAPGVNVIILKTSRGTSTDFDGKFKLKVTKGESIRISFLGYTTQTILIDGQTELKVILKEDASGLDEIVVVGYGSRKKSDVTGAVSSIKTEELNAFPVLDAAQALQGRAAGVVVQSNNGGEPGAPINIKIRGNTSINASSSPLIVVDGFVGATMPQSSDIASLEVLKDASSTAIYGSQGSNGVVLVTTKKGKNGKINVEFNTTYSVQSTSNRLDLLNAEEFADYQNDIRINRGNTTAYIQGTGDTDWQDLIYGVGSTTNHQASFSGGTDKINFYASGNYFDQEGLLIGTNFERGTYLTNLSAQVTDKLKLGMNLFGSRSVKNGAPSQSSGANGVGAGGDDVITLALRFAPDKEIRNEDGSYSTNDAIGDEVDNPYAVATERIDETKTDEFRSNIFAQYDLLKNLSFKTTFGYSTENITQGIYSPSVLTITAGNLGGRASIQNNRNTSLLSENYLTYKNKIGKGDLTFLAGYSYQRNIEEVSYAQGTGIISDGFSFYGLGSATTLLKPTTAIDEIEIQSQFGRINYDYDDKYLFTATVRRDGASNFAANEKYAVFPSAALGWKISNEKFLEDNEIFSNLKLRVSYGVTGNPSIDAYSSLASLTTVYASSQGSVVSAVTPNTPANPNLKWESSYQSNIGIDIGFLNNRISFSADYYNIDTKDLILNDTGLPNYLGLQALNTSVGSSSVLANAGEINNSGFELAIGSTNISKDNFSWTTDFNIAFNKNEVVKLASSTDFIQDAAPSYFSNGNNNTHILRVGEEVGLFYGLDYAGVYQGGDLTGSGTATIAGGVAGDPLFVDIDGDDAITASDREIIGNPNPDYTFGITNSFRYKNWDLNVFFQGSQGGEIFNLTNVQLVNADSNTTKDFYNSAWTPTNTDTNTPRVGNNSNREISSRFIEDGSYIRLKNLAIGYNLPSDIIEKLGLAKVRFSVSAQNLWTITDYSGLDPEVNFFGSAGNTSITGNNNTSLNTSQGFDFGNYPTVKTVSFSLNIKF